MNRQRSGRPSAPRLFGASALHRTILLPILLVLLSLPVTGPALAADLHAVLVIDTGDQNIGTMVRKDMNLMDRELAQIASLTGMTLRKTVLEGANFKLNRITGAIEGLSVGRNDVIVFYYSGHGFRTQNKQYKWPYFWFHNNEPLDFAWVIQALQAKGARLVLALTDACNNVVNAPIDEPDQYRAKAAVLADSYRALFLQHRGLVAATSSIPGEYSTATRDGSLFTLSFLKALNEEGAKAQPNWQEVMKQGAGKKLYFQGKYKQTPYYELNVTLATPAGPGTSGGGAQPVRPPMPPTPTVQVPGQGGQPPAPANDVPVMKCGVPAGAGPASGEYARMPYWRGKFFKGLHYGKVGAANPAACHSACQQDPKCVSWIWLSHDKSCVFKHYCPKEAFGPDNRAVSGFSGRAPLCEMGPGCGLKEVAAPAPAPMQPQPLGGGMPGWGGQPAPAPAAQPQQGGGWQSIN